MKMEQELYRLFLDNFSRQKIIENDYNLVKYRENVFVGVNKNENPVIVIKAKHPNRNPVFQKSKKVTVDCNLRVRYNLDKQSVDDTVHVLKCQVESKRELEIFFLVFSQVFDFTEKNIDQEQIISVFSILVDFFSSSTEMADSELLGLYGELFLIRLAQNVIPLQKYWHKNAYNEFDFLLPNQVRVEVKSTLKNTRRHHFSYGQLVSNSNKVYVVSFLFKHEDQGLTLLKLIMDSIRLIDNEKEKKIQLLKVISSNTQERLESFCFGVEYGQNNMRIFPAPAIPHLNCKIPIGVTGIEYDSVVENIAGSVDFDHFLKYLASIEKEWENV